MSGWKPRILGLALLACVGQGYGQAQVAGDAQGAVPQGRATGKPTLFAGFRMYTLDGPSSLVETVSAPVALYTPQAEFSEQARKGGINGLVVISVRIDPDGKTSNVRVIRGVGFGLDEEAMKAVSRYKFRPAMRAGVPVAVEISVEVSFRIYKK